MSDQPIKIGDFVHLYNERFGYLDTCGYVRYEPHFAKYGEAGASALVQTSEDSNRDQGSGTWKIVSVDDKADGEALLDTDRIFLLNCYPDLGYLALFDRLINDDFNAFQKASPDFKGGAFLFTVYENALEGRSGVAAFNLKLSQSSSSSSSGGWEQQSTITSGSNITVALDSGGRAHALGLKSLETPTKYPLDNYQTRLQAVGPISNLEEMLTIQYPEQQTGLVVSASYWDDLPGSQVWTITPSNFRR
jgi:hypothetical protein